MKRGKTQTIKEVASILKSIYSIVLIIGIIISAVLQVYPYLLQQLTAEIMRVVTPMLVAVLISYVFIRIIGNSIRKEMLGVYQTIYGKFEKHVEFITLHSQIQTRLLGSVFSSRNLEHLDPIIAQIKRLDELWEDPQAAPLYGVPPKEFVANVILVAKWWNIPFEDICRFLIQKLGKERVKELVDSSEVLKIYGKDCLSTWNELMK